MLKPRAEIRGQLEALQRRRRLGDAVPPVTEVALRAGLHRDTVYAAIKGEPVCARSWWGLGNAMEQLEDDIAASPSRIMSIQFTAGGPVLKMGLGKHLFRRR